MLHEMEVVVYVKRANVRSGRQGITIPNEVTSHFNLRIFYGFFAHGSSEASIS